MTVTLLAVGLFAAGFGTMTFLRSTLYNSIDASVRGYASTDAVSGLIDVEVEGGQVSFTPRDEDDVPPTPYFVAVYGPDGALEAVAGGSGGIEPDFPDTFTLQATAARGLSPFALPDVEGDERFLAAVDVFQPDGVGDLFTQMVVVSTASTNQVVATFLGIYAVISVVILGAGALGTRWLVTLTFRSLGQVEDTAMSIASGDFSQRMTDIEPRTEVGRLKIAINTMLGRIDAAISQREATVRQMRRFIGDASHELRTPLVTVRGYAELYRMGAIPPGDDTAQAMDRIEKEAIRMGVLVEDLLALARLDERRDVDITPVDLRPVARDAALDVRATSPKRTVTVIEAIDDVLPGGDTPAGESDTDAKKRTSPPTAVIARAGASLLRRRSKTPPSAPADPDADTLPIAVRRPQPVVSGDENRIRQVVANLLGNARRFTGDDSPIELRVGVDPVASTGWIEVVDHGEGVPDQLKEKIFQRFWRADTSRTRETGGTGLGLSIVASIVDALHGDVRVLDTPGGGATFRVSFPLAQQREPEEHLLIETQPLPRLERDDL
ncbi:sensor histidine kinase [Microbacterium xanthum]|uniref:sensor histidine kinase n=1 Tax=Microbacterium xanthum TaxID=3079794 RepID=UPI003A101065